MLTLVLRVVPNAKRQKLILDAQGVLKLYVTSVPENGKANAEVIAFFAKHLKIPRALIDIVSGRTGRKKTLVIRIDYDLKLLYQKLGLPFQSNVM